MKALHKRLRQHLKNYTSIDFDIYAIVFGRVISVINLGSNKQYNNSVVMLVTLSENQNDCQYMIVLILHIL